MSTLMDEPTKLAPLLPLPNWNFHVIEYPGLVEDYEEAVRTMGGSRSIEKAFAADVGRLELRYRYDDPFSHPIFGDVINTSNLLLKITRKRKKGRRSSEGHDPKDDFVVKTEIVGVVTKTCRFRSIADFQIIPNPTDPVTILRRHIAEYDIAGMEQFQFPHDFGGHKDATTFRNFPPPAFSRIQWPQNYGYRENPNVKVNILEKDGQPAKVQLIHQYRKPKFFFVKLERQDKEVPKGPPDFILKYMDRIPKESLERVKELFEKRPVWTRLALCNYLPPQDVKIFKQAIPFVAYGILFGAWKGTWVRYGYDPRADPMARMYQILFMRLVKKPAPLRKIRNSLMGEPSKPKLDEEPERGTAPNSHIFDGTSWTGLATVQICDITDPEVTVLINSGKGVRKTYDEKNGWYEAEFRLHVKDIIRNKIIIQSGREGKEIQPLDFDEDEQQGGEDDDFLDELILPSANSSEMTARVDAKVSKLLKSIHTGSSYDNLAEGDDDEFQYYDGDDGGGDDDDDDDG
ncbi:tau 95 subunit of transcription factor TFIIIC [Dinochytrium kinnereticum]|nr:tau 95 subunit of transcription factor TFIIIC [Dinochytrium kinnereticum]